jgi:hypothetical protein
MANGTEILRAFHVLGKMIKNTDAAYDSLSSATASNIPARLKEIQLWLEQALLKVNTILGDERKPDLSPTAQDLLTWLNGRAINVTVMHEDRPRTVWLPSDDISIEDKILRFCEEENIDIKEEVKG